MADVREDADRNYLWCEGCGKPTYFAAHHVGVVREMRRADVQRNHRACPPRRYSRALIGEQLADAVECAPPFTVAESAGTPEQQWSKIVGLLARAGFSTQEQAFFAPLQQQMIEHSKEERNARAA